MSESDGAGETARDVDSPSGAEGGLSEDRGSGRRRKKPDQSKSGQSRAGKKRGKYEKATKGRTLWATYTYNFISFFVALQSFVVPILIITKTIIYKTDFQAKS